MSYKCEIIADSLSPQGNRLTSFVVTYPRIIHAEMCRHRILSRNTASSRAIPFKKMVKDVQENPFIPIAWQKAHKGMQGNEYFKDRHEVESRKSIWLSARNKAVEHSKFLNGKSYDLGTYKEPKKEVKSEKGVTKQLCNRLLEPFMWTTEIISGTEWENFFKLRCPQYVVSGYPDGCSPEALEPYEATFRSKKDAIEWLPELEIFTDQDWLECNESQAEIHIQKIAELMWDAYNKSTPKQLKDGEWHIPFGDNIDTKELAKTCKKLKIPVLKWKDGEQIKAWVATARCARISYQTLGANPKIDYEADIKLHDRLLAEGHMSPFEHCARAMTEYEFNSHHRGIFVPYGDDDKDEVGMALDSNSFGWCGNFRGFIQYRHMVES